MSKYVAEIAVFKYLIVVLRQVESAGLQCARLSHGAG